MGTWNNLKTYSVEKEFGHFSFESTAGQRTEEDKAYEGGEKRAVQWINEVPRDAVCAHRASGVRRLKEQKPQRRNLFLMEEGIPRRLKIVRMWIL